MVLSLGHSRVLWSRTANEVNRVELWPKRVESCLSFIELELELYELAILYLEFELKKMKIIILFFKK